MKNYPAISRLTLVLKYITGIYRTKKEIIAYLEENDYFISNKTLERDLKFLKDWEYDVEYTQRGYIIRQQVKFENELFRRFNELFKIKEIINKESEFLDYVLDTSTEMTGVELLPELFDAFKQQRKVEFIYKKFDSIDKTLRKVIPLWLKEDEGRWYLIGIEDDKTEIRTFGLDRIHNLKILDSYDIDMIAVEIVEQIDDFKYMIGITKPIFENSKRYFIELGVSDFLLEYWKSKPIHTTQNITNIKKGKYTIVEFTLIPNITLIKLIVSGLGDIKLIRPKNLKNHIIDKYGEVFSDILK